MSIFSQLKDETAPALAAIEEDAAKAIDDGRQWIASMFARLNDFKTALEKDIADCEAVIVQAASDAESAIAGKKETLAKVNAEIETYSGLVPAPAQALATSTTEQVSAEPQAIVEPAAAVETVLPAPAETNGITEPDAAVEPAELAATTEASGSEVASTEPAPAAPAA